MADAATFLKMARHVAKKTYHTAFIKTNPYSTACGAGRLLGQAFDGDRRSILTAAAEALEDWNFHGDAAKLREMAGN